MKKLLTAAALALACALSCAPAYAQVPVAYQNTVANRVLNFPVTPSAPLPVIDWSGSTPITASSGNVANASAAATLAAAAAKTTFITGFRCQAAGATAASVVSLTVAGVITGTQTYTFVFPAGATTAANSVGQDFTRPVPASAVNTAIVVTLPAGGAGNTNASCVAQGFQF